MNEIIRYLRKSDTFARYVAWWVGGLAATGAIVLAVVWSFKFLGWLADTQVGAIIIWTVVIMAVLLGPPAWVYYDDRLVNREDEGLDLEEEFGEKLP